MLSLVFVFWIEKCLKLRNVHSFMNDNSDFYKSTIAEKRKVASSFTSHNNIYTVDLSRFTKSTIIQKSSHKKKFCRSGFLILITSQERRIVQFVLGPNNVYFIWPHTELDSEREIFNFLNLRLLKNWEKNQIRIFLRK